MSVGRTRFLIAVAALVLLTACGPDKPTGPVRTPMEASEVAQRALRSAHLDEEIVSVERRGGVWVVTTRWRETSMAGHIVTVDAARREDVRVERYRTLQLDQRP